jgi:glycosyltransferase involved in cell wall biosynthesis
MPPQPRIALVAYAMYCGGMEAFLLRLGRYLRQQRCDVDVITTIEPGEWFGRLAELDLRGFHVSGNSGSGILSPLQHSMRVRDKLAGGDYDVAFLNHSRHAQACIGGLPDHMVVIPILHNDNEEIYRVGCANADAWNVAVAVSPKVAESARKRVPRRPVLQILSGVELPDETLLAERPARGSSIRLVFIGRLEHHQKGVLWLPEIYRTCLDRGIDATLTIVGDGPDAAQLQQRLADHSLGQRTQLLKGLAPEEVYRLLSQSHVLLMPSRFEGLPIALLEALACGCVPIVSRLPGITDVAVTHGENGMLVEPADLSGFADAVGSLARDRSLWSRMSGAARERASREFSVEGMGSSYLRLIQDARNGYYPLPRSRKHQLPVDLSLFSWRDFLPVGLRRLGRLGRSWVSNLSSSRLPRSGGQVSSGL